MTIVNDITGIISPFVKNNANTMIALRKCEARGGISYFDFQIQIYNDTVIVAIYLVLLMINYAFKKKFKYHYVVMMYFSSCVIRNAMFILNTYNDDIQVLFALLVLVVIFWMSEYRYTHSYVNSVVTGTLTRENCKLYLVLTIISNVAYFIYNMTQREYKRCIPTAMVHLLMIEDAELWISIVILLQVVGFEIYPLVQNYLKRRVIPTQQIKLDIPKQEDDFEL